MWTTRSICMYLYICSYIILYAVWVCGMVPADCPLDCRLRMHCKNHIIVCSRMRVFSLSLDMSRVYVPTRAYRLLTETLYWRTKKKRRQHPYAQNVNIEWKRSQRKIQQKIMKKIRVNWRFELNRMNLFVCTTIIIIIMTVRKDERWWRRWREFFRLGTLRVWWGPCGLLAGLPTTPVEIRFNARRTTNMKLKYNVGAQTMLWRRRGGGRRQTSEKKSGIVFDCKWWWLVSCAFCTKKKLWSIEICGDFTELTSDSP